MAYGLLSTEPVPESTLNNSELDPYEQTLTKKRIRTTKALLQEYAFENVTCKEIDSFIRVVVYFTTRGAGFKKHTPNCNKTCGIKQDAEAMTVSVFVMMLYAKLKGRVEQLYDQNIRDKTRPGFISNTETANSRRQQHSYYYTNMIQREA